VKRDGKEIRDIEDGSTCSMGSVPKEMKLDSGRVGGVLTVCVASMCWARLLIYRCRLLQMTTLVRKVKLLVLAMPALQI
jgi:hypothetical protein